MSVTILVPGVLRGDIEDQAKVRVDVGGTLGEVLDEVAARWPRFDRRIRDEQGQLRRYVNVFVDGEECRRLSGLATPVPDGTEIQVLPSVAGG
ncbi:molybdopterin synthase sulfur carrier subunit [Virgisporangium aliadipatigenens]|uniref:Molybdopterin synthase sulfur carrier subunit n=1 Tax=Virgisporangium aliadipatigenens TaxID=741659 RepID=A0A8J3YI30_9ACTN|nr:ubiquitin-like small modifier protein 1 [Virgisporangium aliadipatigenens]GIJ45689.1 molybdopterin synthase sulfur carrier subunit [Virgisporangium aliadipatigenens]